MRVLIVDDEAELADMVAEGLRLEGFTAHVAHGDDIEEPGTFRHDYDVIVLDRDTPALSQEAVRRRITESKARILMVAAAGQDDMPVPADSYLTKPFTYPELVERVRALGDGNGRKVIM